MRMPDFLTLLYKGAAVATFALLLLFAGACQGDGDVQPKEETEEQFEQNSIFTEEAEEKEVRLRRNGKIIGAPRLGSIYTPTSLDSIDVPFIEQEVLGALASNSALLQLKKRKRHYQIGNLRVEPSDMLATIGILRRMQYTKPLNLEGHLDAYKIWGADQRGHVRFTGYFTPIIKVSKTKTSKYKYPIYSRPIKWEGKLPSRAEIEGEGVLDTMGLALAYAENKVDLYYMQVQGSGYVEYPNGKKELFAYNGNNRYPYRSIEKYIISRPDIELSDLSISGIKKYLYTHPEMTDTILFQNPSYTFFIRKRSQTKGAGGVPLIADYSIAVDRRYIPLGACLIAAFPIYDHRKAKSNQARLPLFCGS